MNIWCFSGRFLDSRDVLNFLRIEGLEKTLVKSLANAFSIWNIVLISNALRIFQNGQLRKLRDS